MKADTKGIGRRLKYLREYSGLSRERFGCLFDSEEGTVYHWENGNCIPRTVKLMNISMYFDISLDCILCGRVMNDNMLEKQLCVSNDFPFSHGLGRIIRQYNALSSPNKERLMGYLDALSLCAEERYVRDQIDF